jgi:hypothetical protein
LLFEKCDANLAPGGENSQQPQSKTNFIVGSTQLGEYCTWPTTELYRQLIHCIPYNKYGEQDLGMNTLIIWEKGGDQDSTVLYTPSS